MKKIFLLFAAVCCIMVANAQTQPDNEIWYTSSDKQVINPNPSFGSATIEGNEYDPVANKGVITFNSAVTEIGAYAFTSFNNLTSIILPNSVTTIGYAAFGNCRRLTSVTLPNSITYIETSAFSFCESLTSINLPSSMTSIISTVFASCKSLTSIKLPSSITEIEVYAFHNCEKLKSITLPSNLQTIWGSAFQGCTGLVSITVLSSTPPVLGGPEIFDNVNKFIPVYVPDVDAYSGWGGFTNLIAIEIDEFKQAALDEINATKEGVSLTEDEVTAINGHITTINGVTTLSDENLTIIENAKNAALAVISQAIIRNARNAAIEAIEAAIQGQTSAYITDLAQQYIGIINTATSVTAINNAKETALAALNAAMGAYQAGKAEALGTMGEPCTDCPSVEVTKGTTTIRLYNPDKVEFK